MEDVVKHKTSRSIPVFTTHTGTRTEFLPTSKTFQDFKPAWPQLHHRRAYRKQEQKTRIRLGQTEHACNFTFSSPPFIICSKIERLNFLNLKDLRRLESPVLICGGIPYFSTAYASAATILSYFISFSATITFYATSCFNTQYLSLSEGERIRDINIERKRIPPSESAVAEALRPILSTFIRFAVGFGQP